MNAARSRTAAAAGLLVAVLAGCGSGADADFDQGRLPVTASFYVLQEALTRVGGDHVEVTTLTRPGAEPHDVELTPKAVADLQNAHLVVYLRHFQPAVDDAVATLPDPATAFDVGPDAMLTLAAEPDGHDHGATDHSATDHADEHDTDAQAPAAAPPDPHFWLDPTRYADVVLSLGERMSALDPAHAPDYRANAATYAAQLRTLDEQFTSGLAECASDELVTGHAAFAYLADRYHLHQVPVSGLSPEAEPTASSLAAAVREVRETGVGTVYAETLASPALVETLARETGTTVRILDPVEGITDESAGHDYLEVMRSNLTTLRTGQECR